MDEGRDNENNNEMKVLDQYLPIPRKVRNAVDNTNVHVRLSSTCGCRTEQMSHEKVEANVDESPEREETEEGDSA